jgi:gliding motility-associated lipoprotein GldH
MRQLLLLVPLLFTLLFASCGDSQRVFEANVEFGNRHWLLHDTARFEFKLAAPEAPYNLYFNVRNDLDYKWSRIFVNYTLQDSTGRVLGKQLVGGHLFDLKTGKPFGQSAIGDIYDHRLEIARYKKLKPGKYTVKLQQFMREDTLRGILAAGFRLERSGVEP